MGYMYSPGGPFNELDFLTHVPGKLSNAANKDSIFNQLYGSASYDDNGVRHENLDAGGKSLNFKTISQNTENLLNYYKDTVYRNNENDLNQYLKLIKDFNADGYDSVRLEPGDFAYLKELGIYPLNRMWCLRRFSQFTVVPDHLLDWGGESKPPLPISTLVGWIPPGQDKEFFSIDFNEQWETVTERLDQIMMKIMDKEFHLNVEKLVPLPGWSQGILFAFLNEMGLTRYGWESVPQGNPNILQEAATRQADGESTKFGLQSNFSMTLTTEYEQKFIGDIDPGSAMLDILNRIIYMGTSDTEYIFSGKSEILGALRNAAAAGTDIDKWWTFVVTVVDKFINAVKKLAFGFKESFEQFTEGFKADQGGEGDTKKEPTPAQALSEQEGIANKLMGVSGLVRTILASTVAKWRWALVGSISLMDGSNSTPWHLTLGNPYSPFVSFGNVKISSVKLSTNNEFGYNDMPTRVKAEITVNLGRNIGAQEIFRMFNNGYSRIYDQNNKPVTNEQLKNDQLVQNTGSTNAITNTTQNTTPPTTPIIGGQPTTLGRTTITSSTESTATETVPKDQNPTINSGKGNGKGV